MGTRFQSTPFVLSSNGSSNLSQWFIEELCSETNNLAHFCAKLLNTSSSIEPSNIDMIFERICEDGLYDRDQCQWTDRSHFSGALLFLNTLTERLYAALSMTHPSNLPKRRIWVLHPTASSMKIRDIQTLLLVNHDSQGVTTMDEVHAIAEVASDVVGDSLPFALETSFAQHDRSFLFSLRIQKSIMHLIRYDRCGYMNTSFSIQQHPRTVLHCMATLATCDSLGFSHKHEFTSIQTVCSQYTQKAAAPSSQSTAHHAHIRFAGPPPFGPFKMMIQHWGTVLDYARFVCEMRYLQGIPQIASYRSMTLDCTVIDEKGRYGPRCVSVESVIQPVERLIDITYFSSRKEFFVAIVSCLQTHRSAYFNFQLLHTDINVSSICLKVDDENGEPVLNLDGTPPVRQAMLRGWRFAKLMKKPKSQIVTLATLTESEHFVATEILYKKACFPRRRHDLESFLWVMLFICINYMGPYGQKRTLPSGVPSWLRRGRLYALRQDICEERFRVVDWVSTCNACFSPYFNHTPIVKGLSYLASKLSPPGCLEIKRDGSKSVAFPENPVTHDDMIQLLEGIITKLPVEQPPSEDVIRKAREAEAYHTSL